jgi:hypothetical protein
MSVTSKHVPGNTLESFQEGWEIQWDNFRQSAGSVSGIVIGTWLGAHYPLVSGFSVFTWFNVEITE